jgi:predicted HicB family RNase H-like nuclease
MELKLVPVEITVRLDKGVAERFARAAASEGLSVRDLLERLAAEYVKSVAPGQDPPSLDSGA